VHAVDASCRGAISGTQAWRFQEVLMSGRTFRMVVLLGCLVTVLPLLGCALFTDMLNPDFLSALGVDPATVIRPRGVVVIAFKNSTIATTDFGASVASSLATLETDPQYVYARDVGPNETRTMVVDCPVGVIAPSAPIEGNVATAVGEGTQTSGQTTEAVTFSLVYMGSPLVAGSDFDCGDVVEVRVVQTGGGADGAIVVTLEVRVLAGR
jgi:hypothetical protein